MQGFIREKQGRGGYWELVVEAPKDPVTGKRRPVRRGFRGTKRQAEKALRELAREVDAGRHRSTDGTVALLLDRWLDLAEAAGLSPTTLAEYHRLVDKRIGPGIGHVTLRKLDAEVLDAFYADLRADGLAPASVRQIHAIIRRALAQALRWGWVDTNEAYKATPGTMRKHEIQPPDQDEIRRLWAAADRADTKFGVFLRLAARTGARRGELCALRHSSVDLEGATLLISRSVAKVGRDVIVKDTKTHSARRIGLGTTAVIVEALLAEQRRLAEEVGVRLARDPYLFSDCPEGCHPWDPQAVSERFRRLRDGLDLHTRLHDLRHAHASELGARGVDIRTIAGRLGHAQPSTTLNMYSHVLAPADQRAVEIADEIYREED